MSIFDEIIFNEYLAELREEVAIFNIELDQLNKRQAALQEAHDNLISGSKLVFDLKLAYQKKSKIEKKLEKLKENLFADEIKAYQEQIKYKDQLIKEEAKNDALLDVELSKTEIAKKYRAVDTLYDATELFISFLDKLIENNMDFDHPQYIQYRNDFFSKGVNSYIDTLQKTTGNGDQPFSQAELNLIQTAYQDRLNNAEKMMRERRIQPELFLPIYQQVAETLYQQLTGQLSDEKHAKEEDLRNNSALGIKMKKNAEEIESLKKRISDQKIIIDVFLMYNHDKTKPKIDKLRNLNNFIEKSETILEKCSQSLAISENIRNLKSRSDKLTAKVVNHDKKIIQCNQPARMKHLLKTNLSFSDKCYYFLKWLFATSSIYFYDNTAPKKNKGKSQSKPEFKANACHYAEFSSSIGSTGVVFSLIGPPSSNQAQVDISEADSQKLNSIQSPPLPFLDKTISKVSNITRKEIDINSINDIDALLGNNNQDLNHRPTTLRKN